MKSVGNLTDFVRQHMLEAFPVEERIEKLCSTSMTSTGLTRLC